MTTPAIVEIDTGRLEGLRQPAGTNGRTISVFHGVPYAAAPVGDLRFRSPQPAVPWSGTRLAQQLGPAPMQSASSPFSGVLPGNRVAAVDEDCLTLDVWAPDRDGPLPVLVWIPGGAYLTGGSSVETYDGSVLAADGDLVVVGVNYRLGAFGFAWFGDADTGDSNCGLRDQLAALAWVRRNIEAFGGDPGNVTVFGESAGAGSLAHLLVSPGGDGIARRCILQSPGIDHTLYPDDVTRVGDALLAQLSLSRSQLGQLRRLPAADLVDAQEAVVLEMLPQLTSMPFHPFVDGELIPASPSRAIAAGAGTATELLVSWTADEMRLYPNPTADGASTDDLVRWTHRYLARRLGRDPGPERARDLVDFYRDLLAPTDRCHGSDVWAAIQTDGVMRLPARRIADSHSANGGSTLACEFAWSGPPAPGEWDRGSFHAIDLPFTFGTLGRAGWRQFLRAGPDADLVASQHVAAWSRYAHDGRVVVEGVGEWPGYSVDDRRTLVFDAPCSIAVDPLAEVAKAWDGLWSPDCRAPNMGIA